MIGNSYLFWFLITITILAVLLNVLNGLINRSKRLALQKEYVIKVLHHKNQVDLFKACSQAEEREKERIARNLHDEINPMLTLLTQNLQKHKFEIDKNKFNTDAYENDYSLIEKISEGIRTCSYDLVPSYMTRYGLIASLEDYVRSIYQNSLKTTFKYINEHGIDLEISKNREVNIYRICLELITNVLKHTSATKLDFIINVQVSQLSIEIRHNGEAVNNEEIENLLNHTNGLGLKSLKARSLLVDARINYTKEKNLSLINVNCAHK